MEDARGPEGASQDDADRLPHFASSSTVGFFRTSPEGLVLDANPAILDALGVSSVDEVNAIGLRELYASAHDRRRFLTAVMSGPVTGFETEFRRPDGEVFAVALSGRLVRDRAGNPQYIEGTLEDITERRKAEAKARTSERLLREVFEFLPDATFAIDAAGQVTVWNHAMETLTGVPAAEMLGKGDHAYAIPLYGQRRPILIDLVVQPNDEIARKYTGFRRRGSRISGESYVPGIRGREAYLMGTAGPLFDDDGNVIGAIETIRDMTQRRLAEKEQERAKLQAEAASRAWSVLLCSMSHDLRTPLNTIIGYGEVLQDDAMERGLRDMARDLQRIRAAGVRLLELVGEVVDLSRIEAGQTELQEESFELSELVVELAAEASPLMEMNANRFEVRCSAEAGSLHTDRGKLKQCLLHLLSNAARLTHNGVVTLTVERVGTPAGDRITAQVSDTGIGMSSEQAQQALDPLAHSEANASRRQGGAGLGLAIARRLCQMLGGDITYQTGIDQGTTFTLLCPAAPDAVEVLPQAVCAYDEQASPEGTHSVLVIDDDPEVQRMIAGWLSKEGFRVTCARGGEQGLELARALRPDVITLDVVMPRVDGWTVLQHVKSDPELSRIPVVLCSFSPDREKGYALGAFEYLLKPVDRRRLLSVVNRLAGDGQEGSLLVIEDDLEARLLVRRCLEKVGWEVVEAENGRVGLARLDEVIPDIILLDLLMPQMDGFEVLEKLHDREDWRDIPVIVVTARDLTEAELLRLNRRVDEALRSRICSPEDLVDRVRSLVLLPGRPA